MVTSESAQQSRLATDTWRLFTAVQVGADVHALVANAQRQLAAHGWPVRWVAPELAHITLQFYGATPTALVPELTAQLAEIARGACPLTLVTGDVSAYPSSTSARVLWLGLTGHLARLSQLALRVAATAALVPGADTKPFRPHITLGRVRERDVVPDVANALIDVRVPSISFDVNALTLVRSVLGPSGPTYTTLAESPFGAAPRPEVREHG